VPLKFRVTFVGAQVWASWDLRHFGPKTFRHYVFGNEVSHIFALVPKCLRQFGKLVHETLRTQNKNMLRVC